MSLENVCCSSGEDEPVASIERELRLDCSWV